ncbi:MAG: tRNA (adenosine(37)-N6)-threonylcarbamoyltransferase complex dimerization subunit type 1 TsaB [Bryobacterales bacterium]|nr:tRNA (adenosine(37)-N6)-threonylcarbamoyltransferase complex dimerization subunit type 1 TsaB [Bryobacterales bacterium]
MILLAIDSSTEHGGIALWRDGEVTETIVHSPDGFAHVLFVELERLLAQCGVDLTHIDAFAAASGPGSFTGVRVALSAAKGFGEAFGKPVFAISNLRAMAAHGSAPLRAAILDARRGDIYGGLYDAALRPCARKPSCSSNPGSIRFPRRSPPPLSNSSAPIPSASPNSPPAASPPLPSPSPAPSPTSPPNNTAPANAPTPPPPTPTTSAAPTPK